MDIGQEAEDLDEVLDKENSDPLPNIPVKTRRKKEISSNTVPLDNSTVSEPPVTVEQSSSAAEKYILDLLKPWRFRPVRTVTPRRWRRLDEILLRLGHCSVECYCILMEREIYEEVASGLSFFIQTMNTKNPIMAPVEQTLKLSTMLEEVNRKAFPVAVKTFREKVYGAFDFIARNNITDTERLPNGEKEREAKRTNEEAREELRTAVGLNNTEARRTNEEAREELRMAVGLSNAEAKRTNEEAREELRTAVGLSDVEAKRTNEEARNHLRIAVGLSNAAAAQRAKNAALDAILVQLDRQIKSYTKFNAFLEKDSANLETVEQAHQDLARLAIASQQHAELRNFRQRVLLKGPAGGATKAPAGGATKGSVGGATR